MRVPRPITIATVTFLFPIFVSIAAWLSMCSIGDVFISTQIAVLAFQIQKYFWSEADVYEVRRFLFRGK